jgi:hypothetical protein
MSNHHSASQVVRNQQASTAMRQDWELTGDHNRRQALLVEGDFQLVR